MAEGLDLRTSLLLVQYAHLYAESDRRDKQKMVDRAVDNFIARHFKDRTLRKKYRGYYDTAKTQYMEEDNGR